MAPVVKFHDAKIAHIDGKKKAVSSQPEMSTTSPSHNPTQPRYEVLALFAYLWRHHLTQVVALLLQPSIFYDIGQRPNDHFI